MVKKVNRNVQTFFKFSSIVVILFFLCSCSIHKKLKTVYNVDDTVKAKEVKETEYYADDTEETAAVNKIMAFTSLNGGGTGALDKVESTSLITSDSAIVVTSTKHYFYTYDSISAATESSPDVICPDDLPATGRWLLTGSGNRNSTEYFSREYDSLLEASIELNALDPVKCTLYVDKSESFDDVSESNVTFNDNVEVIYITGIITTLGAYDLEIDNLGLISPNQIVDEDGAGTLSFGDNTAPFVYCELWGGAGDNSTINTNYIDSALATGKNLAYGPGTYLTTGGHRMQTESQQMYGVSKNESILKKSTGTNYLVDTTWGQNFMSIHDMTFDSNDLDGEAIIWRGHYSNLERLIFKNASVTYALHVSGVNSSIFNDFLFYDGVYGGITINDNTDPGSLGSMPTYSCLYSKFISMNVAATTDGSAIDIGGDMPLNLTFRDLYAEHATGAVPTINITGSNVGNIYFYDTKIEHGTTLESLIKVADGVAYDIHFQGGKISSNAANTLPAFEVSGIDGFSIKDMLFYDNYSLAGRSIVTLESVKNATFLGNTFSCLNDFVFIDSTDANSSYITEINSATRRYAEHTGTGSNDWTDVTNYRVINSEFNDDIISTTLDIGSTDTTITEDEAGVIAVEGDPVLMSSAIGSTVQAIVTTGSLPNNSIVKDDLATALQETTQDVTIDSDPKTVTYTKGYKVVKIHCTSVSADLSEIRLDETDAVEGDVIWVINDVANRVYFQTYPVGTGTTQYCPESPIYLSQYQSAIFEYQSDRWTCINHQTDTMALKSRSFNASPDSMDDDDYNGDIITGINFGETVAQWGCVFLASDGKVDIADADAAGEFPAIGIAVSGGNDTDAATILVKGVVRNEGWTGLTVGGAVYLGDAGAGAITQTAPSTSTDCVQKVGIALSDSEIFFDFSHPYVLVE